MIYTLTILVFWIRGEKVSYTVAVLSEKYSVSERKVYALVKRFQSDCKMTAV